MMLPEDPDDIEIEESAEYWIAKRKPDHGRRTIRSNKKDLAPFLAWCREAELSSLSDLDRWSIEQYQAWVISKDWAPITIKNRLQTLSQFLRFWGTKGAFNGYLHPVIDTPNLDRSQEVNTEKWDKTDALPQIKHLRNSAKRYGTIEHAIIELAWFTGRRAQAIAGLDMADYVRDPGRDDEAEGPYVQFRHRPDENTRLKNKGDSEDPVELPESVCDVLDHYIVRERWDKRDENGRKPLLTTRQGRASISKIRGATYQITQPCLRMRCPHGEEQDACQYRMRDHASKCPSSRSPHRIRTGSIQWQLDRGVPPADVSDRVDADEDTIRRHYDVPDDRRKMEERRRQYTDVLDESIEKSNITVDEKNRGESDE